MVHVANIVVDPARLDQYKAAIREIGETSLRIEPGVLMLYSVAEKNNSNHIMIMEVYPDTAAYQSHLQTAHFKNYKSTTRDRIKSLELIGVVTVVAGIKIGQIH